MEALEDERRHAALRAEYAEVNSNFRLLTDIRFKLLAFLPLIVAVAVAATGAARSNTMDPRLNGEMLAISLFGLVVTVALATYNARNDQIYVWLVERGARIERELGLSNGSFSHRPGAWLDISYGLGRWPVGHGNSVAAIYLAATAVWLTGCLTAGGRLAWGSGGMPGIAYGAAVSLALALTIEGSLTVRRQRSARRRDLRNAAKEALSVAAPMRRANLDELQELGAQERFVDACMQLMRRDRGSSERLDEIRKRIAFYAAMDERGRSMHGLDEPDENQADVNYLALIIDLPPSLLLAEPQRR